MPSVIDRQAWIERAKAAYVAAGVEVDFAQVIAEATYDVWVEQGSDPDESPEECVEADLECWDDD